MIPLSPAAIIALIRDGILIVGVGLVLLFVYQGGEDRVKSADLKGLQAEIQQQANTLHTWRKESTDAQDQLSKDISAINSAAFIPVRHVWVRDSSCPQPAVLPTAAGKANDAHSEAGGFQPGRGTDAAADRRDFAIAEFKRKWETTFAECRSLDAQWPQ